MAHPTPLSWYIRTPATILLLFILILPVTAETITAGLQVQPSTSCPQGCSCMPFDQAAKLLYVRCSENTNPCGYDSAKQPLYCYKSQPTACPSGCECLSDSEAKAKYGTYVRCSETSCGVSSATTAAIVPKYCVKGAPTVTLTLRTLTLVPTPTCPSGCSCMPEAKAKEAFGSYERCSEKPCSAGSATTATAAAAPDYCFRAKATPSVCPEGCDCITPDDAKLKFGFLPDRCSSEICGYYQPVTTAATPLAKYCFKRPAGTPTITATPAMTCPEGCTCLSKEEGIKYGYPVCHGTTTICGKDNAGSPLYCFEKVPNPQCVYDYNNNACSGTCSQGYSCGLVYSTKDDSGKVTAAVCDCIPPATSSCSYDKDKNACTGTCQDGGQCIQVGLSQTNVAAPVPMCGCEVTRCYFDYAKDSCVGSCGDTAEICQLNTIYRDTTGKTTYAECHCKGAAMATATTTPAGTVTSPAQPCGTDAVTGECAGVCPADKTCSSYSCTVDSTGKKVCSDCRCIGCEIDPASGSCRGYCPMEGNICRCAAWTMDSLGKVSCNVESGCLCRAMCRQDGAGGCSGECPSGGTCSVSSYITGKDGVISPVCSCGAAGTTTPAATSAGQGGDVIRLIGDFFRNMFGMK